MRTEAFTTAFDSHGDSNSGSDNDDNDDGKRMNSSDALATTESVLTVDEASDAAQDNVSRDE